MKNRSAHLALFLQAVVFLHAGTVAGDEYRVERRSQWEQWQFPAGVVELGANGWVTPTKFPDGVNAALDAHRFSHKTHGGAEVAGGVRRAGSNLTAARNIIDGNPNTFWKPAASAPLEDWWIELDLGRVVPVTKIRLLFPDGVGARPFREFRVFGADGRKVLPTGEDVFSFNFIGGTTRPNRDAEVEYVVEPLGSDETLILGDSAGAAVTHFALIQYVRFKADAISADAALAEMEVHTFGENIAPGTFARGGSVFERTGRGDIMADGDVNTVWTISFGGSAALEKQQEVIFWNWDLGALFWIKRISLNTHFSTRFSPGIENHQILASDGTLKLNGELEYELLFDTFGRTGGRPAQLSYLFFPPRPMRYLSAIFEGGKTGEITEVAIFAAGHVAEVEMKSDFIDLGDYAGDRRPKTIQALNWEAELPQSTRVLARTRTGNTLEEVTRYFHRDGSQLSASQYQSTVKALRGETITTIEVGKEWSEWSNIHQFSGQQFLSPSPRRFVQILLLLASDRADVAPTLKSVSLDFTDALLAGIVGEIFPKETLPGAIENFSFRLRPRFGASDSGFDRILLEIPSRVHGDSLVIHIGGRRIDPTAVRITRDSLLVDLPQVVREDSVALDFPLQLTAYATLFKASVGHTQRAQLWQPVDADPAARFATTVFLPSVPASTQLIAGVSIQPRVISPNGDGAGDQALIRLSILKVEMPARVRIYALNGELIDELPGQLGPQRQWQYTWGRDPPVGKSGSSGHLPDPNRVGDAVR